MLVKPNDVTDAEAILSQPPGSWSAQPAVGPSNKPALGMPRIYSASSSEIVVVFDVLTPMPFDGHLAAAVEIDDSVQFGFYPPTIYSDRPVEAVAVLVSFLPAETSVSLKTKSVVIKLFDAGTGELATQRSMPFEREWKLQ